MNVEHFPLKEFIFWEKYFLLYGNLLCEDVPETFLQFAFNRGIKKARNTCFTCLMPNKNLSYFRQISINAKITEKERKHHK